MPALVRWDHRFACWHSVLRHKERSVLQCRHRCVRGERGRDLRACPRVTMRGACAPFKMATGPFALWHSCIYAMMHAAKCAPAVGDSFISALAAASEASASTAHAAGVVPTQDTPCSRCSPC